MPMKITKDEILGALNNANFVIGSVYSKYEAPYIHAVKIGKSRTEWGSISLRQDGWRITVSNVFEEIENERAARLRFREMMIHECIHTIPGCCNHGKKFKRICTLINQNFPEYNIWTTSEKTLADFGINFTGRPIKYNAVCRHCKTSWDYKHKPRWADKQDSVICPYCHKKGFDINSVV